MSKSKIFTHTKWSAIDTLETWIQNSLVFLAGVLPEIDSFTEEEALDYLRVVPFTDVPPLTALSSGFTQIFSLRAFGRTDLLINLARLGTDPHLLSLIFETHLADLMDEYDHRLRLKGIVHQQITGPTAEPDALDSLVAKLVENPDFVSKILVAISSRFSIQLERPEFKYHLTARLRIDNAPFAEDSVYLPDPSEERNR